jgi:hypothetical protein
MPPACGDRGRQRVPITTILLDVTHQVLSTRRDRMLQTWAITGAAVAELLLVRK